MTRRYKINRVIFIAAAGCILALCLLQYVQLNTLTLAGQSVNHTNLVKLTLEKLEASLNEAESNQRGYLLTRQQGFIAAKEQSLLSVNNDLLVLDSLIADNNKQVLNASQLRGLIEARVFLLNKVIESAAKSSASLKSDMATSIKVMRMLQQKLQQMASVEDKLLTIRMHTYRKQLQLAPAMLFLFSIVSLGMVSFSFYKLNAALLRAQKLQVTEQQLEEMVAKRTAELNERKQFAETILNASIDVIAVYDTEMRVLTYNKASEGIFGARQEKVIGRKYYDLFPGTKFKKGYYDLERALQGETIHNASYKSDISGRMYENFLVPLKNADGETYAAVVIAHDITEVLEATNKVKQINDRLQARNAFVEDLLNASPDKVFVVDKQLNLITVNASALESFGASAVADVLDKNVLEVLPVIKDSELHDDILEAFKNRTIVRESRRSPVSNKYYYQTFVPLINDGDVYAVMIVSHDITELVAATTALQTTNASLEKMNEELTSFAHVASHDLQEPLRKIQIFVQRLKEREVENLTEQGKDYFNRMEVASKRMQQLIKDLLTYSSANGHDKHFELTDLNQVLDQVLVDLKEPIEERKVQVKVDKLPTLRVIPFQFQQLFTNLLSNSMKFAQPDLPAVITITCNEVKAPALKEFKANKDAKYYHIAFSDNGIGFDPRYRQQIFKVFQRLHNRNEYSGTGIGLSIVKKIVDTHNGFVSASGEPGKGAIFNIYIPKA